ncbi:activity-dependent neuroprotector homeobox protein 2-like isoform X2 [Carassius auratus]|uniref:Activity-dependent neuroprotector homeobox protein 2-like isoform X2 n=1 Tax=Carassius auratus TaxID=7957 RepID=A0A6P6LEQ9_CARAU|nr:activity-dependent neuroprotector homeobox protein 2-like isoform X2 [Carassius auratus]
MYQIPVKNLTKLRRPRKRVKSILCDIGMQQCQDLLETYKCFDAGDASFDNTEWDDFTDGHVGKKKKKYPYRSQTLCCSLCWYSSRSIPTFRSHIHRCHWNDLDVACLLICPYCPFVSSPKVTEQHIQFFHMLASKTHRIPLHSKPSHTLARTPKTVSVTVSADAADDRYRCTICGYHDSLLYVMKKHVLVNHYTAMLDRYFGLSLDSKQKTDGEQIRDGASVKYHCKVCKLPAETIEHLLYHILSSEKHKELHWQIMACIIEKDCTNQMAGLQNLLKFAPKAMQQVTLLARPNYGPQQMQHTNGNGTVLLAGPSNTTALFCSPGAGQMFLSPQTQALLSGTPVQHPQSPSRMPQVLPTSPVVKPINMKMPNMPQGAPKTVPITMAMPRLPQTNQAQQVLLPPGVQVNLPGEMGVRAPFLVTQGLQLNQSVPRAPLIAPQSVHLIPTGNNVNGVPTFTLAPVQVTVPVNGGPGQAVLSQNQISQPTNSAVVPKGLKSTVPRAIYRHSVPNELAVLAPFLKKHDDHTVKCLRCKILLTEQGIFQHLLHGLKCLFCPQMFYSFKQIMEHTNKEHSLKIKENRHFIKQQFSLDCDDEGNLVFNTFNLNTDVPKDLLDNRELNLALVTSFQDKLYIKMYPDKAEYATTLKTTPTACPFCQVKLQNFEDYERHLQTKHHIVPTIHAILKTPAYKCIYCFGVYTEKSTPKTISTHVQRCRCAPKAIKEAEKQLNPDTTERDDGDSCNSPQTASSSDVACQTGLEFVKPKKEVITPKSRRRNSKAPEVEVPATPVKLVLEPMGMEMTSFEDRKDFLSQYFHRKPYVTKTEIELLASRLWINKADVKAHFNSKLTKCLKAIQKKRVCVRLGFKMMEVNKLKHNLFIPEVKPVKKKVLNEVQHGGLVPQVTVKKKDVNEIKHDLFIPAAPVTVKKKDVNEITHDLFIPAAPVTVKKEDTTEFKHDLFIPVAPVTVKKEDTSEIKNDLFIPAAPATVKKEDTTEIKHDLFIPAEPVTVKKEDMNEIKHDLFIPAEPVTVKKEDTSEIKHDLFSPAAPVTVKKEDTTEITHDLFIPAAPVTVKKEDTNEITHDLFSPAAPVTVKKEDMNEITHDLFSPAAPVTVKKEDTTEITHDLFFPAIPVTIKEEYVNEMEDGLFIPGITVKQEDVSEM